MSTFSIDTPAALKAQVALEVAVSGLGISGGNRTTITNYLPTGASWPTFTALEACENLVRSLYQTAMTTARAIGPTSVATTAAAWDALCGFQNIFDEARRIILAKAIPLS